MSNTWTLRASPMSAQQEPRKGTEQQRTAKNVRDGSRTNTEPEQRWWWLVVYYQYYKYQKTENRRSWNIMNDNNDNNDKI